MRGKGLLQELIEIVAERDRLDDVLIGLETEHAEHLALVDDNGRVINGSGDFDLAHGAGRGVRRTRLAPVRRDSALPDPDDLGGTAIRRENPRLHLATSRPGQLARAGPHCFVALGEIQLGCQVYQRVSG